MPKVKWHGMEVIMEYVSEIMIGGLIAIYAGYVIVKKVKNMKAGKFCDCGCGDCSSKASCGIKK